MKSSHVVEASLPDTFVKELLADAVAMRSHNVTTLGALRKLAGKASWATGIGPSLRSFLAPFWAVIGDAAVQSQTTHTSAASRRKARKLWRGTPVVPVRRVAVALDWIVALLRHNKQGAALRCEMDWRVLSKPPAFVITCDASPWGLGAVLTDANGRVIAWFACEVTQLDADLLEVKLGDCTAQAAFEGLALLVALREWSPKWTGEKLKVHVRSDSAAALGAVEKMASPSPGLNLLTREVAIDVALATYAVKVSYGHIAGVLNEAADALSRLTAPEPKAFPESLDRTMEHKVAPRVRAWWRSSSGPSVLAGPPPRGARGRKRKAGHISP